MDILATVYDFVVQYAQDPDLPALSGDQVIRAVQNAMIMPQNVEVVLLSNRGAIRHGTTLESPPDALSTVTLMETVEHIVDVALYSAEPAVPQEVTQRRALLLEMVARSSRGADFFTKQGLDLLYADNVNTRAEWDDTHNYNACYMLSLHIAEQIQSTYEDDYFTALNVRSTPAHDPDTRPAPPGWVQTENPDNYHQ